MKRILVAGIGNIFLGDDAFGCEEARNWPNVLCPRCYVRDFGIPFRFGVCNDGRLRAVISFSFDVYHRGEAPGTLYLIEPEMNKNILDENETEVVNAHSMNPVEFSVGGNQEALRRRMRTWCP